MDMWAEMVGMKAVARGFKTVDAELPRIIRKEMKEAVKPVVKEAQDVFPKKSGAAAKSIRSGADQRGAIVRGGNARSPYFGWIEFGGRLPPKKPVGKQAISWPGAPHPVASVKGASRPKRPDGRYLYPTAERMQPEVAEHLGRIITDRLNRGS